MEYPPAVAGQRVRRSYGEFTALDDFDVEIPQGEIYGILGPNGSGKSTFLALLAAGEAPDSGTIEVFGSPIGEATKRDIGVVFQEPTLDPLASAGENISLAGRMYGLSRSECHERGEALLAEFGLEGRYGAAVKSLSGGMRRRVELARAMVHGPALLVLDEPTTGIDPEERQQLWTHIRDYVDRGGTVVVATNDLAEADAVCTQATFIRDGRAVAAGTPEELKAGLRRESVILEWVTPDAPSPETFESIQGISLAAVEGKLVQVAVEHAAIVVPRLFEVFGEDIQSLQIRSATLEDAYFQHVARHRSPEREAVS